MNDSDGYNIGKQLAHIITDDGIIKIAKKKREKRKLSAWEKTKAITPLAITGGVLGMSKGMSEKSIEKGIEGLMQKRKKIKAAKKGVRFKRLGSAVKKKLPWSVARGITGGLATVVISLSMMDMMKRFKRRAETGIKIRNKR